MKRIYFLLLSAFASLVAMAQEGGTTKVDVNLGGETAGASNFPWLWVIGGLVFLILLVALLNNRGGRDRIVEKTTVVKD